MTDCCAGRSFCTAGYVLQAEVIYAPDANGNIETVTEGAAVLTRTFDRQDRVKSYRNSAWLAGETIGYRYDANGNLKELTYPDGKVVTYGYDEQDRVRTVTDWATPARVTTFTYDNAGRLARIDRANGTARILAYDDADRLTRVTDQMPGGRLVTLQQYGFDEANRLTLKLTAPKMHPASFPTFNGTYDWDKQAERLHPRHGWQHGNHARRAANWRRLPACQPRRDVGCAQPAANSQHSTFHSQLHLRLRRQPHRQDRSHRHREPDDKLEKTMCQTDSQQVWPMAQRTS